jgi:curli biogenesis system outer membrane secretion channel CsgG
MSQKPFFAQEPPMKSSISLKPNAKSAAVAFSAMFVLIGAANAQTGSEGAVEKCSNVLGTLAVHEGSPEMINNLGRYSLGSPTTMLRMLIQDSGCFTVVERGAAMRSLQAERNLSGSGMLQEGSNVGAGQLVAADFVMTPAVQFADDTGGFGGAIGGLLGRVAGPLGSVLGGVAGGVKFKEAETTLLVSDVRSGIQVASAQGKASKMNFSLGGWGWGPGFGWATGGGYTKTPEGKLIAASMLENYNEIVKKVRDKTSLVQATSQSSKVNAAASVQATPVAAPVAVVRGPVAVVPVGPRAATPGPAQAASASPAPGAALAGMAALVGTYQGSFVGEEQGSFSLTIDNKGTITGNGNSSKSGSNFNISGVASANSEVTLIGMVQNSPATFKGKIDDSGTLQGQWNIGKSTGLFIGKKQ